ncbi:hypothetical protein ACFQ1S_40260 [Kibdelosporangium lantanae]|uniref:Uncharacterized protein n=1 Tax=Kibdelosporangium lantanae TaxID=1497396 RepID=A0ABW3MQ79_9PSEU
MDGKPDLQLTQTGHGLLVHLRESTNATLCGRPARFAEPTPWFALNGCMQCAQRAVKLGYAHVEDADGEVVALDGFVNVGYLP